MDPAGARTEVREGLLLFTIFFNCSQTCLGVTELATPKEAARFRVVGMVTLHMENMA